MEKNVEKKEAELVITLKADEKEWADAQKKEFNKRMANVNVPGFRKGHVPADIARRAISPVQVMNDAMLNLVNKEYAEIIREQKVIPFMQPALNVTKVSDKELEVNVVVALYPTVTLGEYKNLKVPAEKVEVTDAEIQEAINKDLENHATLVLKDGPAALKDTVVIDFKGFVDGTPFEGGEAKNYELKLGSNSFVPGFEDAIVGLKNGDEKEVKITFPENYVENLAGKEAVFNVKVHDVKQTVLPELNDEFVNELDLPNVKGVESYKANVSYQVKLNKQRSADQKRLDAIVSKAVENSKAAIADQILTEEANTQINQVKKQFEQTGLTYDDFLKLNGTTAEDYLKARKADAEKNIKTTLVIEEICRKENIVVDSAALNTKYEELAKQYAMKLEDIKKALAGQQNELLRNLKNELFTKFILANNPADGEATKAEEPKEKKAAAPKKSKAKKEDAAEEKTEAK